MQSHVFYSFQNTGGLFITGIMVELITDKKQVIDKFTNVQIERCVNLMKKYEVYLNETKVKRN